MQIHKERFRLYILSALMLVIIFDSQTALQSVAASIELCIKSVIPGVLPFLLLGSAIACEIRNTQISYLENLLRIPKGAGAFFLIGQICGYPVGAKLLQDAVNQRTIDRESAVRMMCFCNNASPAFIIGILTSMFIDKWTALYLWIIQIVTSLILGIILPGCPGKAINNRSVPNQNLSSILTDVIKTIANICGWVIVFGMLVSYVYKFAVFRKYTFASIIVSGFFELTNGVFALSNISSESIRLILSSIFLSFGGVCVLMQTRTVAPDMDIKHYFLSRLLHAAISASLCAVISPFIFPADSTALNSIPLILCVTAVGIIMLIFNKKTVAIGTKV